MGEPVTKGWSNSAATVTRYGTKYSRQLLSTSISGAALPTGLNSITCCGSAMACSFCTSGKKKSRTIEIIVMKEREGKKRKDPPSFLM